MTVEQEDLKANPAIAAALSGRSGGTAAAAPARLVQRTLYHGVAGLLAEGRTAAWSIEAAEPIRAAARAQAMWELRHRAVLGRLLSALDAAGVRVLLLKGTALDYDLYRSPVERSRGDSDVLIPPADLSKAREVLEAQGFVHPKGDPGAVEEVRLQETWEKATPDGLLHEIDLHWAALNFQVLADLLPFEAAWARARPLPASGPVPGACRSMSRCSWPARIGRSTSSTPMSWRAASTTAETA